MAKNSKDGEISYLSEMLNHQTNIVAGLCSIALGVILSFPFGFGIGLLPILGFIAVESAAALFIPSLPVFKNAVDGRIRKERRTVSLQYLASELNTKDVFHGDKYNTYNKMRQRIASLKEAMNSHAVVLTSNQIEKLEDALLAYLQIWHARTVLDERASPGSTKSIEQKISVIKVQLKDATALERRTLESSCADLEAILGRQDGLEARLTILDAKLITLADAFEEMYQNVMANPSSSDTTKDLFETVDNLRIEERIGVELEMTEQVSRYRT